MHISKMKRLCINKDCRKIKSGNLTSYYHITTYSTTNSSRHFLISGSEGLGAKD